MKLREWNALGWGVVAFFMSAMIAWMTTDWMIEIVILFAITVFSLVASLIEAVTEPKADNRPQTRRNCKAVKGQFKMYTLSKEDWNK